MTQRHPIQNDSVMFITTVTRDRIPYFLDDALAREAVECLYRVQSLRPFFLHGFVIMPDHCHFLIRVRKPEKISSIMKSYKAGVTYAIGNGKLWQPRFHILIPDKPWHALRYIHHNPIDAGLVEDPKEYRWSSASRKWDVTPLHDSLVT
ncbi:MAG: transposase [Candidatus Peribacteraceae bacterium]